MKKTVCFILAAAMVFSVAACGSSKADSSANGKVYHFGDTATVGDDFEFTPEFGGCSKKLADWADEGFLTPDGSYTEDAVYEAGAGNTLMYFSGTVNYIGTSEENAYFGYDFSVTYDEGYVIEFAGGEASNKGYSYYSGCGMTTGSNNISLGDWSTVNIAVFTPESDNTSRYIRFFVEVPEALEAEPEKVFVIFHINGEDKKFSLN